MSFLDGIPKKIGKQRGTAISTRFYVSLRKSRHRTKSGHEPRGLPYHGSNSGGSFEKIPTAGTPDHHASAHGGMHVGWLEVTSKIDRSNGFLTLGLPIPPLLLRTAVLVLREMDAAIPKCCSTATDAEQRRPSNLEADLAVPSRLLLTCSH